MAFQLDLSNRVSKDIRRIARQEISKAIADVGSSPLNRDKVIHRARTRCKKLRALVRLVQPAFEQSFSIENSHFRDAAKLLASSRDAKVMLDTFDQVMKQSSSDVQRAPSGPIRNALKLAISQNDDVQIGQQLQEFGRSMLAAEARVDDWKLSKKGFAAISGGLCKTHERAIDCLDHALQSKTAEASHEFRKWAKYHWYHMRLLTPLWPAMIKPYVGQLDRLADLLGNQHNNEVLRSTLLNTPSAFGPADDINRFIALLDQSSSRLQGEAFLLGRRLFADPSRVFVKRMRTYWKLV